MAGFTPINLTYATIEPAEGADEALAPIIFLHGTTASKEMWCDLPQIIADKTKRRAYAVDSRNHGNTEWSDDFNFDMNVDDLLHLMDTLSVQKAVIVGHSMGGITANRTALRCPERIEMIFVEDMYVKKLTQENLDLVLPYAALLQEAIKHVPADCPEEDVGLQMMNFVAEKVPPSSKNIVHPHSMSKLKFPLKRDDDGRYVWKTNLDVILKTLSDGETLMSDPKGLYEGPSYFIYGTISPFKVDEDEETIRQFFPKAELIPVENADHSIHVQFPEKFTDIVVESILKQ